MNPSDDYNYFIGIVRNELKIGGDPQKAQAAATAALAAATAQKPEPEAKPKPTREQVFFWLSGDMCAAKPFNAYTSSEAAYANKPDNGKYVFVLNVVR